MNTLCDAFLDALTVKSSSYVENIITAHVCKLPPDLEAGLQEVSKLQAQGSTQAELAIERICFLVDVNKLYDAALGLYDLHLALLVAEQSQKDPREYMPFLESLEAQPDLRMRYSIDDYLGRHEKALQDLADLNEFDEFKTYMVKYDLYDKAISICKHKDNNLHDVIRLYAEFLSRRSKHKDAAYAFEHLGDYRAASEAYRLALLWREALSCAMLASFGSDQLIELGTSLVESLTEVKDYDAAAVITLDYLKDIEGSARLFCRASRFPEAIRLATSEGRPDLLESVIDTGIVENQATSTDLLAECRSQLLAQVPRLQELRQRKLQDPSAFYGVEVATGDEVPDNVSLAPTDASTMGASLFTRYTKGSGTAATNMTRRSSKSGRRAERKRASGKRGTVYEEEYLVNSVRRLVERVNNINDEVYELVLALIRRFMRERARAVETAMVALVELCHESVRKVFGQGDAVEHAQATNRASFHDKNSCLTVENSLELPRLRAVPWVKPFARQPLLGG